MSNQDKTGADTASHSPDILVVVLNYKGANDTLKCLDGLFAQDCNNFDIYLVENGSRDGSKKIINNYINGLTAEQQNRIILDLQQKNTGFTGGVNIGIKHAIANNYDYIALLNNDAVPEADWIRKLIDSFKISSEIGAVTSLLLSEDGQSIDDAGDIYSTWGIPMLRSENLPRNSAPESGYIFGGTGGATLYKTDVFRGIGLFDEKFFAYNEDVDIDWRMQLAGFKVYYQSQAIAYHKHSATSSKMPGFTVHQVFKNLPLVLWKNVPRSFLLPTFIRFVLVYTAFIFYQIPKGNLIYALKGMIKSFTLLPYALFKRRGIQRSKVVSNEYINSIIYHGLPLKQVNRIKSFLKVKNANKEILLGDFSSQAKSANEPKVAIVADWLTTIGGAERVVKSMHELFPSAPIYTSQYNPKTLNWFNDADVRTGWLQKMPASLRKFLPLFRMRYFSKLDLKDYDIIISSTGAEAKAVKTNSNQLNICYMHAPTQYYWGLYDKYIKDPGFGALNPLVRLVLKLSVGVLRKKDYKYAQIPDIVIANSTYIKDQIKTYYKRDAEVIFPPVDSSSFALELVKGDYFIITSRHVPWKKVDLAILACCRLGLKLKVVGSGTETAVLKELAKNNGGEDLIEFIPTISDTKELAGLVSKAQGFIFPSLEPFGIAPIEALSTGTPVIAYKAGGALDFIDEANGIYFDEQTVESLVDALCKFADKQRSDTPFDPQIVSRSALRFSNDDFKRQLEDLVIENTEGSFSGGIGK